MDFRNKSGTWTVGFALTLTFLLCTVAKADLCNQGEDTLITHQIFHGSPATIIRCPPMFADDHAPQQPKVSHAAAVKPHKAASKPLRRPALRSPHYRRQKGLLDALAAIFRPRR
jgi:hypothetical protein